MLIGISLKQKKSDYTNLFTINYLVKFKIVLEPFNTIPSTKRTSTGELNGNVTLNAKWAEIYTISYNTNGGNQAPNPVTEFSEINVQTLANPTHSHDGTFDGWYTNGNVKITSTSQLSGNTELTANWVSGISNATFESSTNRFVANTINGESLSNFASSSSYQYTKSSATTTITSVTLYLTYTQGNKSGSLTCQVGNSTGTINISSGSSSTTSQTTINVSPSIQPGNSYTVRCTSSSGGGNGSKRTKITGFAFIIN